MVYTGAATSAIVMSNTFDITAFNADPYEYAMSRLDEVRQKKLKELKSALDDLDRIKRIHSSLGGVEIAADGTVPGFDQAKYAAYKEKMHNALYMLEHAKTPEAKAQAQATLAALKEENPLFATVFDGQASGQAWAIRLVADGKITDDAQKRDFKVAKNQAADNMTGGVSDETASIRIQMILGKITALLTSITNIAEQKKQIASTIANNMK